jgi:transcriptional/translational regulatory protein YebC/TACO1
MRNVLSDSGLEIEDARVEMVASNLIPVSGPEASALLKLLDALEDNDDVQNVYSNADIDEGTSA